MNSDKITEIFCSIDDFCKDFVPYWQSHSLANGRKRIRFIQVESGMNPFNDRHIPYHAFHELMTHFGYLPFGLYEQHLEWNGQARLRFVNAVFVCPSVGNSVHR